MGRDKEFSVSPFYQETPQSVHRNSSLWWMMVGEDNGNGKDLLTQTIDGVTRPSVLCF